VLGCGQRAGGFDRNNADPPEHLREGGREGGLKRRMRVFARSADSHFAIRWQIEEPAAPLLPLPPPPRSAWNSNGRKYVGSKSNGVLHAEIREREREREREILWTDTEATLAFALPFADAHVGHGTPISLLPDDPRDRERSRTTPRTTVARSYRDANWKGRGHKPCRFRSRETGIHSGPTISS